MLEEKVRAYKQLGEQIETLEEQRKALSREILQMMPPDTNVLRISEYQVRRVQRLSIKTALEIARTLDAIRIEETVDKDKLKALYEEGHAIPGISPFEYIQVTQRKAEQLNFL